MSSKSGSLTQQQVMALLSSGMSFTDLSKKFGSKELINVLISNPDLISGFRNQAEADAAASGLDRFDPNSKYYDANQVEKDITNATEQKWYQMSTAYPKQWKFVSDFFDKLRASGNNPATADALVNEHFAMAKDYGLDDATKNALLEPLKSDRDMFMKDEIEKNRRLASENYKAYMDQRKSLDLQAGESVAQKIFKERTGFGELYDLPDPKETFAALAKKRAAEFAPEKKARELRGTLGKGSKGIKNVAAQTKQLAEMNKKVVAERSRFERAYMLQLEKQGKGKSTPYQEALKKVVPSILLKKALG
jgi:hypothetical protein